MSKRGAKNLYRIYIYDCRPLARKAHNPISKRAVDFSRTETFIFRTELLRELLRLRKVALRLGELADRQRWQIQAKATRRLLGGTLRLEDENIDGLRSVWPRKVAVESEVTSLSA